MKNLRFYQSDFGAPPPPPPPPGTPPPPPSFGSNNMTSPGMQGSASTNAIIALVAGILSFVMCPLILGVVAWIMGRSEKKKIEQGQSPEAGKGLATIGMWLGIANTVLVGLTIIGILAMSLIGYLANFSR